MGFRLNHRLGLFTALAAFTGTAVVGSMAYLVASQVLGDSLRAQAAGASSQLAMRVGDELKHLADRGRFYISTGQRPSFEQDGEILALSVLRLKSDSQAPRMEGPAAEPGIDDDWVAETRWTLPATDPAYVSTGAVAAMDLKFPVDTDRIATGQNDVFFARSGSMGALRIAVPYGTKTANGYTQALVIDAKLGKLQALFSHREGLFAFMTAARGQLVIASDSGHFATGEDLSQLTILGEARDARNPQGSFDYRETPQGVFQYAAYARVVSTSWASAGLTVFAQAPRTVTTTALQPLAVGLTAAALAFAALLGLSVGWIGPRWAWAAGLVSIDGKIIQPAAASQDGAPTAANGVANAAAAPAITPPGVTTPATMVKIQDPKVRQAFEQGQVKLSGERMQAAVLHSHLHGVDSLTSKADPEKLLRLLNEFNQKAVHAIESRQGIVDHMHGGSIVAFWGIPKSNATDVPHAIEAAQEIRTAAEELSDALEAGGQAASRLAMGLHYGPLTVGQVGTAGRLEYSAIGEGLEIAARIQEFAEQFGTDFLMTGTAASRAGKKYPTEQLTAGDDSTPDLYELLTQDEGEESEPALSAA